MVSRNVVSSVKLRAVSMSLFSLGRVQERVDVHIRDLSAEVAYLVI